jgi:hypothetical protein
MIKYYTVGDCGEAKALLEEYQDLEGVDILSDVSQIWRVPHDQGFEGVAVVVTCDAKLKKSFNPNDFVDGRKPMFFSPCKNVFVINCEQSKFKTVKLDSLNDYMSFQLVAPHRWGNSNELAKLFGLPVDEPEFDKKQGWVAPEPEPVVEPEPEPESFTPVDYPLDELPDNGE